MWWGVVLILTSIIKVKSRKAKRKIDQVGEGSSLGGVQPTMGNGIKKLKATNPGHSNYAIELLPVFLGQQIKVEMKSL